MIWKTNTVSRLIRENISWKKEHSLRYSAKEVNDYGYKSFYINDERVYSREWEQKGYNIPLFLNDEDSVNSSKYDLFYFSGKNSSEFEQTLNDTIDEIQKLNKEYTPDSNDWNLINAKNALTFLRD